MSFKKIKARLSLLLAVVMLMTSTVPVHAAPLSAPRTVKSMTVSEASKTGWQTENGKKYYYQGGVRKTGKVQINKNWYYFGPEMKTGLFQDPNKPGAYYYAKNDGILRTDWQTINGKRYYFWNQSINGHIHHEAATGIWSVNGKVYLFSNEGVLLYGLNRLNGKLYYTDGKGLLQTGWRTVGGKRYYFWSRNTSTYTRYEAAYGKRTINGIWHLFSKDGALLIGLNTLDGKLYYTDGSGRLQKGWKTVNGKTYYFDSSDYAAAIGTRTIEGKIYTFDTNGVLVKSEAPAQETNPQEEPEQPAAGSEIYVSDSLKQVVQNSKKNRVVSGFNTCKGILTYYGYDQHAQGDGNIDGSGCGMCSFLTVISTFKEKKAVNAANYRKTRLGPVTGTNKCPISIYAGKKMVENAGMRAEWVKVIKNNDDVVKDISAHLKKGMPVVVSLSYKNRNGKITRTYTRMYHYALLAGITKDGKRAFLMDSGSKGCRFVDLKDICLHIPSARENANKKPVWNGWENSGGYMKIFP